MKVLVAYASSEGQTRKIARWISDRIADSGHSVELASVADAAGIDFGRFDRVILAASIHVGHSQRAFTDFVSTEAKNMRGTQVLFLSISLAAAGHDAEDWTGLDRVLSDFCAATGWTPDKTEQIAGAYKPSQYDVFRRFVMRRIVAAKDPQAELDADKEYTDWQRLAEEVDDWLGL